MGERVSGVEGDHRLHVRQRPGHRVAESTHGPPYALVDQDPSAGIGQPRLVERTRAPAPSHVPEAPQPLFLLGRERGPPGRIAAGRHLAERRLQRGPHALHPPRLLGGEVP